MYVPNSLFHLLPHCKYKFLEVKNILYLLVHCLEKPQCHEGRPYLLLQEFIWLAVLYVCIWEDLLPVLAIGHYSPHPILSFH